MPFPYELYPKAKETHCLNLPEISVSRPPFPGSIRTADGCFWGERDNNSYADTTITASDGTSYKYGTVFTEKTTKGEGIACSSYANCYIGCSCNTSNGWYSSCQGSDCKSATDNHYTGVNSLSAGKSISDVASISASGANSGISASAAATSGLKTASAAGNYTATAASAGLKTASAAVATAGATSGISTMASGATTCYKKKTCSEGGYFDSVPAGKKCPEVAYNGYTCYDTNCTNACPDGWFSADSRPVVTHMLFLESLNNPGCYQASCAPGYSTTVNGAVVAEYQGVKCYKEKESYWPTVMKLGVTSAGCDLNGQPEERMCYFRGGFTLRDDKGLAFADRTYEIIEVESFGGSDSMKEPVYYSYRYGPYVAHSAWAGINIGEMRVSDGKWFQYSGLRLNGKKVTGTREICISITSGSSSFNSKCINDWSNTPQTLKVVMKNTGTGQTKTITLRVEATVGDDTTTGGIGSGGMEIMPNQ